MGLKLESELFLQAVLENEDRAPLASKVVRREPLTSVPSRPIKPLILDGPGRSGTTWSTKMFASHPETVVFRRFPYEYSVQSIGCTLRVLTEPASLEARADPDTLQGDLHSGRPQSVPRRDSLAEGTELAGWLGRDYVERMATFCQSAIEEWYARVAAGPGTA